MYQIFDYFTFFKNQRDINVKNQRKYIHTIEVSSMLNLMDNSHVDKMGGTMHQVHGSWTWE